MKMHSLYISEADMSRRKFLKMLGGATGMGISKIPTPTVSLIKYMAEPSKYAKLVQTYLNSGISESIISGVFEDLGMGYGTPDDVQQISCYKCQNDLFNYIKIDDHPYKTKRVAIKGSEGGAICPNCGFVQEQLSDVLQGYIVSHASKSPESAAEFLLGIDQEGHQYFNNTVIEISSSWIKKIGPQNFIKKIYDSWGPEQGSHAALVEISNIPEVAKYLAQKGVSLTKFADRNKLYGRPFSTSEHLEFHDIVGKLDVVDPTILKQYKTDEENVLKQQEKYKNEQEYKKRTEADDFLPCPYCSEETDEGCTICKGKGEVPYEMVYGKDYDERVKAEGIRRIGLTITEDPDVHECPECQGALEDMLCVDCGLQTAVEPYQIQDLSPQYEDDRNRDISIQTDRLPQAPDQNRPRNIPHYGETTIPGTV